MLHVTTPAASLQAVVSVTPANVVLAGMANCTTPLRRSAVPWLRAVSVYVSGADALTSAGASATTFGPGMNEPKASTYTQPACPPCEQPAAIASSSTSSPTARPALPGAMSTTCQSV